MHEIMLITYLFRLKFHNHLSFVKCIIILILIHPSFKAQYLNPPMPPLLISNMRIMVFSQYTSRIVRFN